MILMLLSILIIITSSLLLALNPITIGLTILIIALTLTITFAISIASWIAFLIFLIYVRGILVLFSYFVAITPNQTLPEITTLLICLSILIPTYILFPSQFIYITKNTNSSIISIYTANSLFTLIILAIILLFTILLVVKIATTFKGPLRPFIN